MITPGPWATLRDAVPEGFVQVTVYAEATGARVATAFETEANARHIAAAPDLLEAVRDAEDRFSVLEDADDRPRPEGLAATFNRLLPNANRATYAGLTAVLRSLVKEHPHKSPHTRIDQATFR